MQRNSKTWIVTKLKNLTWDKIQLKVWQSLKTQTVTKFNNLNCDKTQQLKLWQNSKTSHKSLLLRTTWHLDNWWDVFEAAICDLAMFFRSVPKAPKTLGMRKKIFKQETILPIKYFDFFKTAEFWTGGNFFEKIELLKTKYWLCWSF